MKQQQTVGLNGAPLDVDMPLFERVHECWYEKTVDLNWAPLDVDMPLFGEKVHGC